MKQLNNIRQFSVILLLLSLLPLCVQAQTTESKEYTIVNNVDDLSDGDHIIIVSKFQSKAMTDTVNISTIKYQRLETTKITLSDDKTIAYTNVESADFTLVKTNGKFNIRSNNGKYVTNVADKKDDKAVNLSDERSETTEAEISFDNDKANILYAKPSSKCLCYLRVSEMFAMNELSSSEESYKVYIYKLYSKIKTKTRISFGEEAKDTYNITYGTTDFVSPKANVYADNTIMSDAEISYTSSNTTIATVDKDGNVTINNNNQYGETTITSSYLGDDNHYACSASYTIKVSEKEKITTNLSFGEGIDNQTIVVKVNEEDSFAGDKAILSPVENGDVTYSSSDENVATVDNEGKIRLYNIGETVISANYAGNETYAASSTYYRLQYRGERIVFSSEFNSFINLGTSKSYNKGTYNFTDSLSNPYRWDIGEGRCTTVKNGVLEIKRQSQAKFHEITAPNGYKVTAIYYHKSPIRFTIKANNKEMEPKPERCGKLSEKEGTGYKVTAEINSNATFAIIPNPNAYISRIQIDINPIFNITLDESEENNKIIDAHKGEIVNALPLRTLVADKWNTFCLPFNISLENGKLCGVEAEVREYDRMEGDVMMFKEAKEIVAGRSYLIRPKGENITFKRFDNVRLTGPELEKSGDESFYMIGTYSNRTFSEEESSQYLFLNANAEFRHPKAGTTMKGMRAYFYCSPDVQASQMKVGFTENSTDIKDIEQNNIQANSQRIYSINGTYVGTDKSALPKGIYIIGGKKYIK
ncbi:hypothetical protein [Prevotella sp.]|uniref:hypothetical protein n=1 Tax=Prevotella sp. TaxID=59823 RepID=UPI0025CF7E51|nr:hypothetical protein [Prevotella sp.]